MKKILILIVFIKILTLNSYAAELKDCSTYSKLNPKYLLCKTGNLSKKTMNYQKEQWTNQKKDTVKKKD